MATVEQEGWSGVHVNKELVAKIEKFINTDQAYTDVIRNSALFNRRLAADRKMRLPYYDAQTGVAQSCTSLWMDPRQRMPGKDEGQVYTYPAKTWVKRRRQYLIAPPKKDMMEGEDAEVMMKIEETRDVIAKDEGASKEPWYYEDNEDGLEFDDPDLESDDDYYTDSSRSKRKRRALPMIKTPKRDSGSRSKKKASAPVPPEPINEADKPYACARRPAPVRSRPVPIAVRVPSPMVDTPKRKAAVSPPRMNPGSPPPPTLVPQVQTPVVPHPQMVPATSRQQAPPQQGPSPHKDPKGDAPKAAPSPFCDFCLGDAVNNKKTGSSEELVSCSDCGRSGHPSCLQFTANMMVSVRKYRWQCIECKCCTLCGTSDNDEQLLFCDDCDRGYHMYCLKPPLSEPPEGSWSCHLCVREFHK